MSVDHVSMISRISCFFSVVTLFHSARLLVCRRFNLNLHYDVDVLKARCFVMFECVNVYEGTGQY